MHKSKSDTCVQNIQTTKKKLINDLRFFLMYMCLTNDCIELICDTICVERDTNSKHDILAKQIDNKLETLSIEMLNYLLNIVVKNILH